MSANCARKVKVARKRQHSTIHDFGAGNQKNASLSPSLDIGALSPLFIYLFNLVWLQARIAVNLLNLNCSVTTSSSPSSLQQRRGKPLIYLIHFLHLKKWAPRYVYWWWLIKQLLRPILCNVKGLLILKVQISRSSFHKVSRCQTMATMIVMQCASLLLPRKMHFFPEKMTV